MSETLPPVKKDTALSDDELAVAARAASRGVLWILSSTVLWQAISWVLTLWTARVLSPSDYGLVALADTITPYLVMLATLRLDFWVLQLDSFEEDTQRVVQSFAILLGLGIFAAAYFAAPLLGSFYGRADVVLPFRVLCGVVLLRSIRIIPEARLRRSLRFEPLAISNFTVGVCRALLQLGLAIAGWRYWSLIIASMAAEAILTLWMLAVAGAPRGFRLSRDIINEAFAFGVPASLSYVCWIVFSTADNLVVGRFFGVEMLGYYSMAFYLTELPLSKINMVLQPVRAPYFAKLRSNIIELRTVVLRLNRATMMLVGPMLLGLCAVAPPFVSIVFGPHWIPLTGPFRAMCVVSLLRALGANNASVLLSLGFARKTFYTTLLPAIVMPIAFTFGAWVAGLNGIYLAWFLVYPIVGPYFTWIMVAPDLTLSVREQVMNIVPAVLASAVMAIFVVLLDHFVLDGKGDAVRLSLDISFGMVIALVMLRTIFWGEAKEALALIRRAA